MRRAVGIGLLIAVTLVPAAHGRTKAPAPARAPKLASVTLGIRHRVFHDFREVQTVRLNREFPLGDTEYSARVIQYLPDFQMDLEHHRIFSLGDQPRNPAFRVVVRKAGAPHDTSWAFLKSPPHFGARSYFAFQVLRIDFVGGPPLLADSTLVGPGMSPAPPAPAAGDTAKRR